ncbi:uncharacterized protein METZ01_LOCUS164820 [marine metagenome]|uniref:Uncharacterized protein n=1 Tax=marine metagenome TaxID=408172 RepID=A0A382BDU1_9ZZZZ
MGNRLTAKEWIEKTVNKYYMIAK